MLEDQTNQKPESESQAQPEAGAEKLSVEASIMTGDNSPVNIIQATSGATVSVGYSSEQVEKLLEVLGEEFQPKPFSGKCPYPGLEAFREVDTALFFGREVQIAVLLEKIKRSRFLMIAGPSGSGKSSLVRAGLLAQLRSGTLQDSESWLYATLQPGRQPLEQLALAMARAGHSPQAAEYLRGHASQARALHEVAESLLEDDPQQRMLIFVDQFEEIFTQISNERQAERFAFLDLLTTAASVENGRVSVLCAMRSDFLQHCAPYAQLNALLNQQFFQLGALQPEELVRAVALPAAQVGLRLDPRLVAQVVNDVGSEPGILPLMQFALKDLFEATQSAGGVLELTLEGYLQRGGLHKALQRHAEAEFARLSADEQELAGSIFSSLVEIGQGAQDTRRMAHFSELVPAGVAPSQVQELVLRLSNARLLTADDAEGQEPIVFIPHERLLDAWPWLRRLVDENRQVIALKNKIDEAASEWEHSGRNPSYLYTGARLATAEEQLAARHLRLSSLGQEFIRASSTQAADQKRSVERRRNTILASSVVITVVLAVLAFWALNRSQVALRLSRISLSRQLAAQAVDSLAIQKPIDLSLLLAVESWQGLQEGKLGPIVEADDALRRTLAEAPVLLVRHKKGVNAVAFSPDGRIFATGSLDNTARLWDAASGSELSALDHGEPVTSVAFSPDSRRLATGSEGGTVRVWTVNNPQEPLLLRQGTDPAVKSLLFSPDGRWLVATYADPLLRRNGVRLWDTLAGSEWDSGEDRCSPIQDMDFNAQGTQLAVGGEMGACLVDASAGKVTGMLEPRYSVAMVQFSQDGKKLLTAGDGFASIWDVATLKEQVVWDDMQAKGFTLSPDGVRLAVQEEGVRLTPEGLPADNLIEDYRVVVRDTNTGRDISVMHFNSPVDEVRFVEGSSRLATWNWDGNLRVWDAGLGSVIAEYPYGFGLTGVVLSQDGKRLASAGGSKTHIWEFAQGSQSLPSGMLLSSDYLGVQLRTFIPYRPIVDLGTFRLDLPVTGLAFNPDGSKLVTSSLDPITPLWDARGGQEPLGVRHDMHVDGFAMVKDGRSLVTSSNEVLYLWDVLTGKELINPINFGFGIGLAASPDGKLAAFFYPLEKQVRIWNLSAGAIQATLPQNAGFNQVEFSPDGKRLATASDDGNACVWEAESGGKLACLPHEGPVILAVWSADGSRIATRTAGTVRIWDAISFKELKSYPDNRDYAALTFNRGGELLGAIKWINDAQVWNVPKKLMIARMSHRDRVNAVAFNPDGSILATASNDQMAGLWDAQTGASLAILRHGASVYELAFSPDGRRLVTGTDGDTVYVWRVQTGDLAEQACQIAHRNLTEAEWAQYLGGQKYHKTCPQWP